jgi:hypothetical protein
LAQLSEPSIGGIIIIIGFSAGFLIPYFEEEEENLRLKSLGYSKNVW